MYDNYSSTVRRGRCGLLYSSIQIEGNNRLAKVVSKAGGGRDESRTCMIASWRWSQVDRILFISWESSESGWVHGGLLLVLLGTYEERYNELGLWFFLGKCTLWHINSTFVTLIPKFLKASNIHNFRPISGVNTIYKIVFKLLETRTMEVSPKLFSNNQTAFTKVKVISHNVILAVENLRGF